MEYRMSYLTSTLAPQLLRTALSLAGEQWRADDVRVRRLRDNCYEETTYVYHNRPAQEDIMQRKQAFVDAVNDYIVRCEGISLDKLNLEFSQYAEDWES